MGIKNKNNKGQIMMLSVLMIGTSILVFSSIAGYLMLQRLRAASNSVDSTKAIFAADSGIECGLYAVNFASTTNPRSVECNTDSSTSTLKFDDDHISVAAQANYSDSGVITSIKSIGTASKSNRAFLISINQSTSTP